MYNEDDQAYNERRLIELLLDHPSGITMEGIVQDLHPRGDVDVQRVMRDAFAKSLLRREDGYYFTTPTGAAIRPEAIQGVKSRIEKFNEKYVSRAVPHKSKLKPMPDSHVATDAAAVETTDEAVPKSIAEDVVVPVVAVVRTAKRSPPVKKKPDVVNPVQTSADKKILGLLRRDSCRGRIAQILFDSRERAFKTSEIHALMAELDYTSVSRTLISLSQLNFDSSLNDGLSRNFVTRTGRGEDAVFQWSGLFHGPFCDQSEKGSLTPIDVQAYRQVLSEFDVIHRSLQQAANTLAHVLTNEFTSLQSVGEKLKTIKDSLNAAAALSEGE